MNNEYYIRFFAPVDDQTARDLIIAIDTLIQQQGINKLHLLISTQGGIVIQGINLYNYLSSLPIEVWTYNFGNVDSIGIFLYCAGTRRVSVEHARFLFHPVSQNYQINTNMFPSELEIALRNLKLNQENIINIISKTTGQQSIIEELVNSHTTINSQKAKEINLTHEIEETKIPLGQQVYSIFQVQQNKIGFPQRSFVSLPETSVIVESPIC